ncbi:unknown [Clostridium sp. CAG:352]|nr:unknown [Clostridium sp. CAG:352]
MQGSFLSLRSLAVSTRAVQPARLSKAAEAILLLSNSLGSLLTIILSPSSTRFFTFSTGSPVSIQILSLVMASPLSFLIKCGGNVHTTPVIFSLPRTVTALDGSVLISIPPQGVALIKPLSSIYVTIRPILSICASSIICLSLDLSPIVRITLPFSLYVTSPNSLKIVAAIEQAKSSSPETPSASKSLVSTSFMFSI